MEPKRLQILKALQKRMRLSDADIKKLHHLQKGYEGEVRFRKLLAAYLTSDCLILYDLFRESNEASFQLDCVIIQQHTIWHLEVKNFSGDFQLKDKILHNLTAGIDMKNPLNQLERGHYLLQQSLQKFSCNIPLKSYVVFVHPEFFIYQAQPGNPIIYPAQIPRFITSINKSASKLQSFHYRLAHKLFSNQIPEKQDYIPAYAYTQLRKGIYCHQCDRQLFAAADERTLTCKNCHDQESKASAIIRHTIEFSILFPESKITTAVIWEWCGKMYSRYQIREVLSQFLQSAGNSKARHFIFRNEN